MSCFVTWGSLLELPLALPQGYTLLQLSLGLATDPANLQSAGPALAARSGSNPTAS